MSIKISSDSTCDLSPELVEKYGVTILPLYVLRGTEILLDGVNITPDQLFAYKEETGKLCATTAGSVADYHDYFTKLLETYDEVVHFVISSDMSASYQNACLAAEGLKNVYPVDSRNLSTGIGQLVIEAAVMASEGKTGNEIYEQMLIMRERLDVSFVVDTLEYLHKGGRCSSVAALGANLLSLKPCIEVKDGKMGVGKKYRGSLKKCILQYVKDRLDGCDDVDTRRLFITQSGGEAMTGDIIEAARQEVLKYQRFDEVCFTRTGCSVSVHCGPGTLGLLFFRK